MRNFLQLQKSVSVKGGVGEKRGTAVDTNTGKKVRTVLSQGLKEERKFVSILKC